MFRLRCSCCFSSFFNYTALFCVDSHRFTLTDSLIAALSCLSSPDSVSVLSQRFLYRQSFCLSNFVSFLHLTELILFLTLPLFFIATLLIRLSHIWHPLLSGLVKCHFCCIALCDHYPLRCFCQLFIQHILCHFTVFYFSHTLQFSITSRSSGSHFLQCTYSLQSAHM